MPRCAYLMDSELDTDPPVLAAFRDGRGGAVRVFVAWRLTPAIPPRCWRRQCDAGAARAIRTSLGLNEAAIHSFFTGSAGCCMAISGVADLQCAVLK